MSSPAGSTTSKRKKEERLIHPGDDITKLSFANGGPNGARLQWKSCPDEGWENWEALAPRSPGKPEGLRYADKWQWICFGFFDKPRYSDEEDDAARWEQQIPL